MNHKYLALECFLIFAGLPAIVAWVKPDKWFLMVLIGVAVVAMGYLWKHYAYSFDRDWNARAVNRDNLRRVLLRFVPFALLLLGFAIYAVPERLFSLPLENPLLWMQVMLLYPLLSVLPQEIIYRSFFFRRYVWICKPRTLIIINAIAFGWVHIVLNNAVAIIFSAIGGYLFADTYRRSRSLAVVCIEHAIYGCFIFTIGLGIYFYHGFAHQHGW